MLPFNLILFFIILFLNNLKNFLFLMFNLKNFKINYKYLYLIIIKVLSFLNYLAKGQIIQK